MLARGVVQMPFRQDRHARASPGHPRSSWPFKAWMAGTSPAMTRLRRQRP